jgi:hypothetical protein
MKPKRNLRNRLWDQHETLLKEIVELSVQAQKEYDEKNATAVPNQVSSELISTTASTRESSFNDDLDSSVELNEAFSFSGSDSESYLNGYADIDDNSVVHACNDECSKNTDDNENSAQDCDVWKALAEIQEATKRELAVFKDTIVRVKSTLQLSMTSRGLVHENDAVEEEDRFIT